MLSHLSKCIFRVPSKENRGSFDPNTSLVKRRIWIVSIFRFLIQWNFKDSLSFSTIRIWRKPFSISVQKVTGLNLVLIRKSLNFFWKFGPYSRQWLKEYPDTYLEEADTTLNFVDSELCLINGLCGRNNSSSFSLWFCETFSIPLSTNWLLDHML